MNELLKMILIKLGIIQPEDEISEDNLEELQNQSNSVIDALKGASQAAKEVKNAVDAGAPTQEVADTATQATQAADAQINEVEEVLKQAELSGTLTALLKHFVPTTIHKQALKNEAALSAKHNASEVKQLVSEARSKGLIIAAEEDKLIKLGVEKGIAMLNSIIDARSPIAALTSQQTASEKISKPTTRTVELNAADLDVIKATGISKEDYLASKKELANGY